MTKNLSDPLLFEFFTEIGIINQLSHAALEHNLPHGLKVSQFVLLNHLVRLGQVESPAQLASALQVTKGAVTNNLQRLLILGFITIETDPKDKRAKLVNITKAGIAARGDCLKALGPMMQEVLRDISVDEFKKALPFLTSFRKYMDERRF